MELPNLGTHRRVLGSFQVPHQAKQRATQGAIRCWAGKMPRTCWGQHPESGELPPAGLEGLSRLHRPQLEASPTTFMRRRSNGLQQRLRAFAALPGPTSHTLLLLNACGRVMTRSQTGDGEADICKGRATSHLDCDIWTWCGFGTLCGEGLGTVAASSRLERHGLSRKRQ